MFIQEIFATDSILRFCNIRTNAGSAAKKLFGQNVLVFLLTKKFVRRNHTLSKS